MTKRRIDPAGLERRVARLEDQIAELSDDLWNRRIWRKVAGFVGIAVGIVLAMGMVGVIIVSITTGDWSWAK